MPPRHQHYPTAPSVSTAYYECNAAVAPSIQSKHCATMTQATSACTDVVVNVCTESWSDIYASSPSERKNGGGVVPYCTSSEAGAKVGENSCGFVIMDGIRKILLSGEAAWCPTGQREDIGCFDGRIRSVGKTTTSTLSKKRSCSPFIGYDGTSAHYLRDDSSSSPSDVAGSPLHPLKISDNLLREKTVEPEASALTSALAGIGQYMLEDVGSLATAFSGETDTSRHGQPTVELENVGEKQDTTVGTKEPEEEESSFWTKSPLIGLERDIISSFVDSTPVSENTTSSDIFVESSNRLPLIRRELPKVPSSRTLNQLPPLGRAPPPMDYSILGNRTRLGTAGSLVSAHSRSTRQSYHRRVESPMLHTPREVRHLILPFIRRETTGAGEDNWEVEQSRVLSKNEKNKSRIEKRRPAALDGIVNMEVVVQSESEEMSPMHDDTPRECTISPKVFIEGGSSKRSRGSRQYWFKDYDIDSAHGAHCIANKVDVEEVEMRKSSFRDRNEPGITAAGTVPVRVRSSQAAANVLEGKFSSFVRKLRKNNDHHFAGWATCKPRLTTSFGHTISHNQLRYVIVLPREKRLYILASPQSSKPIDRRDLSGGIVRRKLVGRKCGYCVQIRSVQEKNIRWSILPVNLPPEYFEDSTCTQLVSASKYMQIQQQQKSSCTKHHSLLFKAEKDFQFQNMTLATSSSAPNMTLATSSSTLGVLTVSSSALCSSTDDNRDQIQESNENRDEDRLNTCKELNKCSHNKRNRKVEKQLDDGVTGLQSYASDLQHQRFIHLFFCLSICSSLRSVSKDAVDYEKRRQ